jgi:hypothetical protein
MLTHYTFQSVALSFILLNTSLNHAIAKVTHLRFSEATFLSVDFFDIF